MENPVWHIHNGNPPKPGTRLSFAMLLNLASVCNTEDKAVLWGFISRYAPEASPASDPFLDRLVGFALRYYQDFVKPSKRYRAPDEAERKALADLAGRLRKLPKATDAELAPRHARAAELILATALRMRGVIIKMCQAIATRADVFPPEFVERLKECHDAVPPKPFAVAWSCSIAVISRRSATTSSTGTS